MSIESIRAIKQAALLPKPKKIYTIPKKSKKKLIQEGIAKEERKGEDSLLENWHKNRRKSCVGTCQCGCGRQSSKKENDHFRSSNAHIFPKKDFPSIMYHPLNHVERNFWDGCHGNMDNRSMDLWINFADWDDIKAKFHELAPLLTVEERSHKFYTHLEKLVYATPSPLS